MTPSEVKAARHWLLLSVSQFADMLDTDASTIRKMELSEGSSQYRGPAPRMVRLIMAYLNGYRPPDWPK
jgi:DNA-binding transcriptional regulator YiaG